MDALSKRYSLRGTITRKERPFVAHISWSNGLRVNTSPQKNYLQLFKKMCKRAVQGLLATFFAMKIFGDRRKTDLFSVWWGKRGCFWEDVPFLSNSGRTLLCCRDTVLPLHSDSGMHPFIEEIWRFDAITLYCQLEQMTKRDCGEIRERCKRQLSQEGRAAQKEGRRGFQQSFLHGKKMW